MPTQWGFAEQSAVAHGQSVSRNDWRVLMSWHIAETREQAKKEVMLGLQKWHNEYNVDVLRRPGALRVEDPTSSSSKSLQAARMAAAQR